MMQAGREWDRNLKVVGKKVVNLEFYTQQKISSKREGKGRAS